MAHEVKMDATISNILNKQVKFRVKKDGEVLGDLKVSKGGIEWRPKNKSVNTIDLDWAKFARMMEESRKE